MVPKQVRDIILKAIEELRVKDAFLLKNDISERAISHKLAVYLNNKFEGYAVDCEYNGYADADNKTKYIIILRQMAEDLGKLKDSDGKRELIKRNVYPDIIVHKRGENKKNSNLLIIEIKKSTSQENIGFDIEKIRRYTSPEYENHLNYQLGAFILFQTGSKDTSCKIDWYINGENKETWQIEN